MEIPYYNTILDRFFEVLELEPNASFEELKKKYHELAFIYHPDKNDSLESLEKMKEINEAYSILKNNKSRIAYVKKYGVYTTDDMFIAGKTYKEEEKEKIKELLQRIKQFYQIKKEQLVTMYDQIDEDLIIESINKKLSKGLKITSRLGSSIKNYFEKLKIQSNDNLKKYTVRNRKTLAGILVAAAIITPFSVSKDVENNEPLLYQEDYKPQHLIEDQLIVRLHKVKDNETLESISSKYNIPMELLIEANNIKYGKVRKNSLIKIPYYLPPEDLTNYTLNVNSSEYKSLNEIAKLYNTDVRTIYSLNIECFELIDGKYYQISDEILVPNFDKISENTSQKTYSKS